MEALTDDSKMTFGVHEGKKLAEVPDDYLIWWYKQNLPLIEYIEDNMTEEQLGIE